MRGDQYKRPTKETYERDLQKRHTSKKKRPIKETYKRDLHPRKGTYLKEIYTYEMRPIQETYKRDP